MEPKPDSIGVDIGPPTGGDTPAPPPGDEGPAPGDAPPPDNTPPTFQAPPPIVLVQGESVALDMSSRIEDAQDADDALVLSWEAEHLAIDGEGALGLELTAPDDWFGDEDVLLVVTDSGGLTASATLAVTVTKPGPVEPPCGLTTFTYAGAPGVADVRISGSFNGWPEPAAADALLDEDGDGTWEVSLVLGSGVHSYKLIVDGEWIADPGNPDTEPDGFGGVNSLVSVPPCGDPPDPGSCGEAHFSYVAAPGVVEVLVSGSFNGWGDSAATADALSDADGDGTWTLTLTLEPGTYHYKLIVDGAWITDPANPESAPDGVGGSNSVLDVPECPDETALLLLSYEIAGGALDADIARAAGGALAPGDLTVTVDWDPAPAGAVIASGSDAVHLALTGLPGGIHDVRVSAGGEPLLLKVYVGVSTDWRDVVIYFAMTDRFSNGDPTNDAPVPDVDPRTNFQGGDFAGISARIEEGYFDALGVGAIWISWPVDNADGYEDGGYPDASGCGLSPKTTPYAPMPYTAYHGYWPSNLDQIEAHFGTLGELQTLVTTAHSHGIRVLLDFTANHVHDSSALFVEHADEGWFNFPAENCEDVGWDYAPKTCWFTPYLPDLNYNHPGARKAVIDHAIAVVTKTGADGFRFDAVKHLEMSFIQALRARTKAVLELTGVPFYIVGETFTGDAGLIQSFIGEDKIHGQFDFPSNLAILKGFATQEISLAAMDAEVRGYKNTYGGGELMSTFIGNHDIARFISQADGSVTCGLWDVISNIAQGWKSPPGVPGEHTPYQQLRLALTYAYTIPGVPLVYYGDEYGMPGAGDPDNRRMMEFNDWLSDHQKDTLAFAQALGQAREAHVALRRGSWPNPIVAEPALLAYVRKADSEFAVVVLNRDPGERTVSLSIGSTANGTTFVDALGVAGPATFDGQLTVTVPARSAAIFVKE